MEEQASPTNVFEKVKQIREKQNLSLKEIAKKSRIQLQYLEALESGNLSAVPDVYDKLFFQTYLSFLKLSEAKKEEILKEFREERRKIKPQLTTTVRKLRTVELDKSDITRYKNLFIALPVLLVLIIIGFMVINSETGKLASDQPVEEISIYDVVKEVANKDSLHADSTRNTLTKKPSVTAENVAVRLNAIEQTWLRAVKDHSDTSEYLLKKDEQIVLNADSVLEFLVGKANGLNFTINEKNEGILGKPGQVITYLKVTEQGIVGKRIKSINVKETQNDSLRVQ